MLKWGGGAMCARLVCMCVRAFCACVCALVYVCTFIWQISFPVSWSSACTILHECMRKDVEGYNVQFSTLSQPEEQLSLLKLFLLRLARGWSKFKDGFLTNWSGKLSSSLNLRVKSDGLKNLMADDSTFGTCYSPSLRKGKNQKFFKIFLKEKNIFTEKSKKGRPAIYLGTLFQSLL